MKPFYKFSFLLLFLFSCWKEKSDLSTYGETFEKVMKSEEGIFRGINLGTPLDSVKLSEVVPAGEEDSTYLYYELALDSVNSINLAYDFESTGLTEIQADILIKEEALFNDMLSKFKLYFTKKYGEAESSNGFITWTSKTEKHGNIKIALSDESTDPEYNKLSLSFYNADY